jgi:choline transporter-like protein 2/4/5
VQIATTGKGFCKASELATDLIMNNILRIGQVNVIGDVILFLGKLCVSLFSALFAFLMLDNHKYRSAHNKTSSPLFPVLVSKQHPFETWLEHSIHPFTIFGAYIHI